MQATTDPRTPGQREDEALLLEAEMTEIVRTEIGMHEAFASQVARAIVQGLRRVHGARRIYIPGINKEERNRAIRAEFNGRNHAHVMQKYDISRSRLYEIVGAQQGTSQAGHP
jgi:Mor family transcriptional regulator